MKKDSLSKFQEQGINNSAEAKYSAMVSVNVKANLDKKDSSSTNMNKQ